MNGVESSRQIGKRPLLVGVQKHQESIPLARHILLLFEEVGDQFRSVRDQKLEIAVDKMVNYLWIYMKIFYHHSLMNSTTGMTENQRHRLLVCIILKKCNFFADI